jgi:hypothetical protein
MKSNKEFFNFKDEKEGNVSIGEIPDNLKPEIDNIAELFYDSIPKDKLDKTTYHRWYSDLDTNLKQNIDKIKQDLFWKNFCDGTNNCKMIKVDNMDEIYYANPPKTTSKNLYGAVGNYYVHRDGHFPFFGTKLYRVLIGVTGNNKNIMTYLTNLNYGKPLNKYDYLAFDFDKTTHQVLKFQKEDDNASTYRIVLKLHFLVCENCNKSDWYLSFLKTFYTYYLYITRYVMETGTNPKSLPEFFFGMISLIIGIPTYTLLSLLIYIIILFVLSIRTQGKNIFNKIKGNLLNSLYICISLLIIIVLIDWFHYFVTNTYIS